MSGVNRSVMTNITDYDIEIFIKEDAAAARTVSSLNC